MKRQTSLKSGEEERLDVLVSVVDAGIDFLVVGHEVGVVGL